MTKMAAKSGKSRQMNQDLLRLSFFLGPKDKINMLDSSEQQQKNLHIGGLYLDKLIRRVEDEVVSPKKCLGTTGNMPHGACHAPHGTRPDVYVKLIQQPTLRSFSARIDKMASCMIMDSRSNNEDDLFLLAAVTFILDFAQ